MLSDARQFVGAANYVRVFSNASFLQVLSNSCVYMAPMTTLPVAPALLLVLWLNENSIVKNLAQSAIFTPHIVSMVSVGILWIWIMEPDIGLLNYILDLSGVRALFEHFGQRKIMWLEIEKGEVSIVAAALLGAACMAGATETDTLECDLQVTKDGKVIIMHGSPSDGPPAEGASSATTPTTSYNASTSTPSSRRSSPGGVSYVSPNCCEWSSGASSST